MRLILLGLVIAVSMIAVTVQPALAHNMGPPAVVNQAYENENSTALGMTDLDGDAFAMALPVQGGITFHGAQAYDEPAATTSSFYLSNYFEDAEVTPTARNGTPLVNAGSYYAIDAASDRPSANDVRRRDFLQVTGRLVICEL